MTAAPAAVIAAAVAAGGWAAGWLTTGGALAAAVVGTAVVGGGGVGGLALLGTFFVSGSLLSQRGAAGSRRRGAQVLANGWTAALGGLLVAAGSPAAGWGVLAGGLAAAQADTWATELGRRSRYPPRMITTGQPVAAGTSGAISLLGTLGGSAGAGITAALAGALAVPVPAPWIAAAGVAGMLADSLLGATVQARFVCATCGHTVEVPRHCDAVATRMGGLGWMTNDAVNVIGTGAGAAIATLAAGWT